MNPDRLLPVRPALTPSRPPVAATGAARWTRLTRLSRVSRLSVSAGALLVLLLQAGCNGLALQPYRMEVVQGNVVTQEMVARLAVGQNRDQVRGLLGSPLLTDVFHAARWDYVFTIRRQGAEPAQRRVTVFFEGEKLARWEAGTLPSERDFVASIDAAKVEKRETRLELSEAELKALPLPTASGAAQPAPAASGPLRNYPPLEAAAR
jgi:outer membrane protein assembly factor BamE